MLTLLLAAFWLFQRRLIYFPLSEDVPPVDTLLPGAGAATFVTADRLRLNGWFASAATAHPQAAVLVFNGNAGAARRRSQPGWPGTWVASLLSCQTRLRLLPPQRTLSPGSRSVPPSAFAAVRTRGRRGGRPGCR
jgi:hypothetical protein